MARPAAGPAGLALGLVSLAAIAAHALLLPLGGWRPDEFLQFAQHGQSGWAQVAERILGWSPRPVSEVLLFAYSRLVAWQDVPGIVPVLAAAWGGALLLLLAAARNARLSLATPLALFAAALLLARPGEMWFWPAASLAYLPAFAGMGAAALLLIGRGHPAALCAALLLTAGSVEMGAVFVLLLGLAQLARLAAARRLPASARWLAPQAPAWAWLLPALLAGGVLLVLALNRAAAAHEVLLPGPAAGSTAAGLLAGLPDWAWSALGLQRQNGRVGNLPLGITLKLALLAGFWTLLPAPATRSARLSALLAALALLGTALVSVAMAHRQFGLLCCERHEALRQGMFAVALLCLAAALPAPSRAAELARRLGPLLAAIGLGTALWLRLPALRADFALIDPAVRTRAANWASGRAADDAMDYRNEPVARLAGGWGLVPGPHLRPDHGGALPAGLHWHAFAILLFFDKLKLRSP
ncbi:hypothetical protein E2C06_20830 [Dankookia rubra]|uniref:Glycosyltransferase RgtA/B/C/D-like domain-containing protein n=1 Tax=Dankookia rubra TaxID=1442381 RepID=A0A4R5QC57_9PROT|nr:hypothetical protein [Dankookia rubra]TDH60702.1 hypothetical protein E2C06_20830 [Dankookia rubra]